MKVKWENWKSEKFEGKIVDNLCSMIYVKLGDGSIRMVDFEDVTIISENGINTCKKDFENNHCVECERNLVNRIKILENESKNVQNANATKFEKDVSRESMESGEHYSLVRVRKIWGDCDKWDW